MAVVAGPWLGYRTVLMKRYDLDNFLRLSSEIKATTLRILPTIAVSMAKSNLIKKYDLRNVKYIMCSGASLSENILEILQRHLSNVSVSQGYG